VTNDNCQIKALYTTQSWNRTDKHSTCALRAANIRGSVYSPG